MSFEEVTIRPGSTKPIATPIGFDIVPTVVAIVLYLQITISGLNHVAESLAGALSRNGCPIAPRQHPIKMYQKLSIAPTRIQAPTVVRNIPRRT